MPTKEFTIRSDGKADVTEIGLRARLYTSGYKYHLKVAPVNVSREQVRIVVQGEEESLSSFYEEIHSFCTLEMKITPASLSEYSGLEPDWDSYATMFNAEQTAKGVTYLQMTYNKLEEIDTKFGAISKGLSAVASKLDDLVNKTA